MTFGMRVRLWARQAPRGQVVGTAAVSIVVVLLLVFASVPQGEEPVAGDGGTVGGAGIQNAPSGGGSTVTQGGPDPEPGVEDAGPEGPDVPQEGQGGGAPQTPPEETEPTQPEEPQAPEGNGGGQEPEPLVASDRGITPSTIKIGFLIAQVGGLDQAGFALGLRGDMEEVIKAYVDEANRNGGAAGREITYVTEKVDPLDANDQRAACLRMTQDEEVFAVLDSATTLGPQALCYGAEHDTPFFNSGISTVSSSYVRESLPYWVSTYQEGTRQVLNWAHAAREDGVFDGKTLGILGSECAPVPEIIDDDLLPVLEGFGMSPTVVKLSCDAGTAQQQVPNAVVQMRQAGVDLIFPSTSYTNVQVFLQNAEAQGYRPTYTASDFFGMSWDLFTENFNEQQWGGTQAVTSIHVGADKAGKPPPPPLVGCSQILEEAGLQPIEEPYLRDSEATVHCDSYRVFVQATDSAGPNPTRPGWGEAVQEMGTFDSGYSDTTVFGPQKTTGGDTLAVAEWKGSCNCYHQVRGFDRDAYA